VTPQAKFHVNLPKGASRQIDEIYTKIFIAIYLFFFHAPTGSDLSADFFARNDSHDAVSGKGVPFWD